MRYSEYSVCEIFLLYVVKKCASDGRMKGSSAAFSSIIHIGAVYQCLSQGLGTGCLKYAVVKFWGVQNFKGDHNILYFNHKHV